MRFSYLLLVLLLEITSFSLGASSSLSYSGRLVNTDGSPVTGPVNLKFELAHTNSSGVGPVLCDQLIEEVPLTNGVFHVKLSFTCPSSTITKVLSSTPAGESAAIRVTNESTGKAYAYQALHSLPFSQVSKQLAQMGATNGQVLTWNGSEWAPANGATTDGTVKDIQTGSGLMGGPITDSGIISIAPGGVVDAHLASGIDPAKLSGTRDSTKYLKGDNTWSSFGDDVLATIITGFSTASSAVVTATDSILEALGKIQAQLSNKIDNTGGTLAVGTIDGVPTPVLPSQIVNKQYVDDVVGGVNASQWTTAVNDIFYTTGNVGIGTSTPGSKLDVSGGVQISKANTQLVLKDTDEVGGEFAYIERNSTALIFGTNDGATSTIGLTVKDGNVGIGTTSPGAKLEVAGQVKITGGTPGAGKVLTSDASGLATWETPAAGGITSLNGLTGVTQTFATPGTSGTIPTWSSSGAAHTLNIPMASAAGVTAGLISKTDYDAFNSKLGTTLNSGNIWVGNGSNVATAVVPSSDVSMTNTGAFTVTKLQGSAVSTTAPGLGSFLKWNDALSNWEPFNFANCNGTTEVLRYSSPTDTWSCETIGIDNILPTQTANNGKVLTTNGTTASWQAPSAPPAGNNTEVQFNNNGVMGASSSFTWNNTSAKLAVGNGNGTSALGSRLDVNKYYTPSTSGGSTANLASVSMLFSPSAAHNLQGAALVGSLTGLGTRDMSGSGFGGVEGRYSHQSTGVMSGFAYGVQGIVSGNGGSGNFTGKSVGVRGLISGSFGAGLPAHTEAIGVQSKINLAGTTTGGTAITTAVGFQAEAQIQNFDSITNFIGLRVLAPTGAGTITNKYAIVTEANAGNVGIGTTTPATMLDVAGAIRPGADASPCVAGLTGAIRNNAGVIEFCNGTAWTAFATGSTGDFLKDGSVAMTGPFKAADGTPAAPGITFGDDPDTGISNQAANTLTFSVAGTEKFTVSSAGVYTSGATLLQSWKVASQSNDSSSYTPSSTSSKVPLATGFVKAENVSAGNNKMAMFELAVTNTDSTVQNAYFGAFANGSTYTPSIVIGQQTGATAYNERMRIDASGNVGVGTTTPATMLDVAGAIRPGADISPCVAGLTGAIRNNAGVIEFCNGTAWTAFATGTAGDFLKDGSVAMTGAFKAANGTAAAPSISFSSETNTGFYYKNATEVGWSVTGGLRFNFGTNIVAANTGGAGITSANGTATNAAFFFQGDANTGMFSPTLETLGFTTNGAEKMRITSTGNVGIGTTTPGAALHVASGSSSQSIIESLVSYNLNPAARISFQNKYDSLGNSVAMGDIAVGKENATDGNYASFMAFRTRPNGASPQERMRISSAGNVGIGTTTPATMLDVAGAIRPGADISPCVAGLTGAIRNNAGVIEFCNGTAWTAFATGVASSGTNTSVQISDGSGGFTSSTWFNYTSGKLGIGPGTTAPTNSLTVIDSGANAPIAKFQNGDSRGAGIEVKATGTGGADFWIQATADNAAEGGGKLSFRDRLAADASRMVIDSAGKVGIGTTSPLAKMDVNGEIVTSSGGAVVGRMRSLNLETAPVYAFSGGNTGMWAPTTTSLGFSTDGVEKMRIAQNGYVGIKTATPSATLDVNGVATMNASTESITTYVDTATAYTIPDALTNIRRLTLTGNATVTLPSFTSATPKVFTLTVFLKQDATGNRTVSFIGGGADTVKWDSGTAPSIATTASKITIVQFTKPSDETVWYASKVWQE